MRWILSINSNRRKSPVAHLIITGPWEEAREFAEKQPVLKLLQNYDTKRDLPGER
jgi:hypothetical protein